MENIKILVFDIDGTLVARDALTVEQSAQHAIHLAKKKNYQVLIATGRSYSFILDSVKDHCEADYYVTVNGAALNDEHGKIIKSIAIEKNDIKKLVSFCQHENIPLGIKYNDFIGITSGFDYFLNHDAVKNHPSYHDLKKDDGNNYFNNHTVLGVYMFETQPIYQKLIQSFPNLRFIKGDKSSIESVRKEVDKVHMIDVALKKLKLTWDQVMVFGDGNNDIDMLRKARIGVVMGNASDSVKTYGDYITSDIKEDGIFQALKHFKII